LDVLPKWDSEYFVSDLRDMNLHVSSVFSPSEKEQNLSGVMKGQFIYHCHHGGLSIHGGRVTELQNLSNCFEVPSGLSFNFIFEGYIDFSIAGKKYRMGDLQESQSLTCSSIILSRSEILTKYMSEGMQLSKLNIFVERSWLESRCNNSEDFLQLSHLFQQHALVTNWIPSEKIVALARSLLVQKNSKDLLDKLQGEYQIVELLTLCLKALEEHLGTAVDKEELLIPSTTQYQLKEKIDHCLKDCVSLESIASALNMSVSTLQRKFKAGFGITVIEYVRQRRLEIVRAAMLNRGLSVGEAAYLAGYKYPSNFVTAFKKHFTVTPSEFIKSHS
jgi:AraC-like DNA-binding protein